MSPVRVPINNYWVTVIPANIMYDRIIKGCLIGLSLRNSPIL